jgi:hypothetical protein
MQFTSVKVTPAAQKRFLEKNPQKKSTPAASGSSTPLADSTSALSKKRNATEAGHDVPDASSSSAAKLKTKKAKA